MPENAGYYHAAYIVAGTIYTLYTISLWRRRRALRDRRARAEVARSEHVAATEDR